MIDWVIRDFYRPYGEITERSVQETPQGERQALELLDAAEVSIATNKQSPLIGCEVLNAEGKRVAWIGETW